MVSSIPGPFAEVVAGFNAEQLASRGLQLLSQETVNQKVLLQVAQVVNGQTYLKWVTLLSDPNDQTKLVVATFPKEQAPTLSESLKTAALSASVIPQSTASAALPFRVTPSSQFVEIKALRTAGKVLGFSKDGVMPAPSPADPLFIVAPSLGEVVVANREAFALKRLHQFSQIRDVQVESVDEIAINNQTGYEIIATAKDSQSETPLQVYQVMLFPKAGGYVVMVGTVGQDEAEQYLPAFQAMARTYRRTAAEK